MKGGKPIEFKVVWEDWDVYKLENNLLLKVKIPLTRITDSGERDAEGNAKLSFDGSPLLRVQGDIELNEPSQDQIIDLTKDLVKKLNFEVISEGVQIYYIPEAKQLLMLKYNPQEIWQTSKNDQDGYPIHHVNAKISISFQKIPRD